MEADAITFAVGKQRDSANTMRQFQWRKHALAASRGNAIERGRQIVGMQIDNSAFMRRHNTLKFCQRPAGSRIVMGENGQLSTVHFLAF
jgi:hypothetical protein